LDGLCYTGLISENDRSLQSTEAYNFLSHKVVRKKSGNKRRINFIFVEDPFIFLGKEELQMKAQGRHQLKRQGMVPQLYPHTARSPVEKYLKRGNQILTTIVKR
jgi:hypothetical protein